MPRTINNHRSVKSLAFVVAIKPCSWFVCFHTTNKKRKKHTVWSADWDDLLNVSSVYLFGLHYELIDNKLCSSGKWACVYFDSMCVCLSVCRSMLSMSFSSAVSYEKIPLRQLHSTTLLPVRNKTHWSQCWFKNKTFFQEFLWTSKSALDTGDLTA